MAEIKAEIFAVGTWNGMTFTMDDLLDIVNNFNTLKDVHDVPLKFGHNSSQPITDGQPALGWIDRVWVEGEKLLAIFTDVPDLIKKSFDKKLYKNVSIELLRNVKYKGQKFKQVLDAVALLGADRPAVSNLADLASLMSRNVIAGKYESVAFSAFDKRKQEDNNMPTVEELQAKLDAANKAFEEAKSESAKFSSENEDLKKKAEEAAAATKKAKADSKRSEVTALFEEAVKAERILPAQREAQFKLLNIDNDDAVLALDIDVVKASISTDAATTFSKEDGKDKGDNADRKHDNPGEELDYRAKIAMTKDKTLKYNDAVIFEMKKDPDLAHDYQKDSYPGGAE